VIRLAFLGCGKVARAHAKRLHRHRAEVSLAFASRDAARAQAYASELGGRAFASYEEALASPEVDAVAVVTPPSLHLPLTLAALTNKKHVVLEKPPLPRAADFETVAAAAAAAGRRVFVAENYYYKPSLALLRELLLANVIGDVLFIHVNAIKKQVTGGDWRDDEKLALSGALYEGGIHWVDFLANLGLTVKRVTGFAPALPPGARIERSMQLVFEYEEGAIGTLAYSWEVPSTAHGLRLSKIYGRRGSITFETNGLWVLCHGARTSFHIPSLRDLAGYHAMWSDFVRALTRDEEPRLTLQKARRDLELVEQAYLTAQR